MSGKFNLLADTASGIILHPRKTFREILEHPENDRLYFLGALAIVFLASLIDGFSTPSSANADWMLFSVLISLFIGFARWFFLAALVALTVTLFGAHTSRVVACLITTGWAFVPWILMAPVGCYRLVCGVFYPLLALSILVWVVALEWLAVQETYRLRGMEMYCLVFAVPSLFFFARILWIWPFVAEVLKAYLS